MQIKLIFFNKTTQESKYSKDFLELPFNFLLESLLRKVQKFNDQLFI